MVLSRLPRATRAAAPLTRALHTTSTLSTPTPTPPARAQPAQFHVATASPPPLATSASGLRFTLASGETILDAMSGGAAVACLGSSNPDLVEVMARQAEKMPYAYHQAFSNEIGEELAQWLVDRSGGAFVAGAFMGSGSEAVESIIKLVRQYWLEKGEDRKYVIARFPSYHGNTLGALSIGNVPARRNLYSPFITDAYQHVTSPQYKRFKKDGETEEEYSERLAVELDNKIMELGPENVAAFLAEPISGSSIGVIPPPKGYFPAMKRVLDKHNILFCMDEVMCGTGRSGDVFAFQTVCEGVQPDAISMAKGLGAGYVTISGTMVGKRIYDVVNTAGVWKNSHTYQNHPVNCAVALAALQKMEAQDLFSNVKTRGKQLISELEAAFKDNKHVFEVRGRGMFVGIEFEVPVMAPRYAARVKEAAFKNGLLTLAVNGGTDGAKGEAIMLAPAYNITEDEVSEVVRIFKQSVEDVDAAL